MNITQEQPEEKSKSWINHQEYLFEIEFRKIQQKIFDTRNPELLKEINNLVEKFKK